MTAKDDGGWTNSILTRTLCLVAAMVLFFFVAGLLYVNNRPGPATRNSMTTYEVSRLLRQLPISMPGRNVEFARRDSMPPMARDHTTILMARALAEQLRQPVDAVRLYIGQPQQRRADYLEQESKLYAQEKSFNPTISGTFAAAVRNSDGSWNMVVQKNRRGGGQAEWFLFPLAMLAFVIPAGYVFSSRLAKPIRLFSAAAERVGNGATVPIPVTGPAEIRSAARALNEMQARLLRYVTERTSVVGAIAHDLRQPLSRINFHLTSAPEEIQKKVRREVEEMERMIAITIDFVQTETLPRHVEPVDLALLVEGVVDNFADVGQKAYLVTAMPSIIEGDPLLLMRMFVNLIDNAIKFGGVANVSISRDEPFAVIDVEDAGAGMSQTDIDRAFEPFYRGEPSRNRRTGGVGLGLSIVKSAALSHGGSIELSNMETAGLRARVKLPLLSSAALSRLAEQMNVTLHESADLDEPVASPGGR